MFSGEYNCKIDSKGRITFPSKLRDQLEGTTFFITRGLERCIDLFTEEVWNEKIKKLSKSSMETLTIIAFKGPITKSEIEEIKGVSVDGTIQTLLEKKLIYSSGVKKALGNPKLYEVTDNFYGYVGIESKEELFKMEKARWLNEYKGEKIEDK